MTTDTTTAATDAFGPYQQPWEQPDRFTLYNLVRMAVVGMRSPRIGGEPGLSATADVENGFIQIGFTFGPSTGDRPTAVMRIADDGISLYTCGSESEQPTGPVFASLKDGPHAAALAMVDALGDWATEAEGSFKWDGPERAPGTVLPKTAVMRHYDAIAGELVELVGAQRPRTGRLDLRRDDRAESISFEIHVQPETGACTRVAALDIAESGYWLTTDGGADGTEIIARGHSDANDVAERLVDWHRESTGKATADGGWQRLVFIRDQRDFPFA